MNATTLIQLGHVSTDAGDLGAAERWYREAIDLCRDIGLPYLEAMASGSLLPVLTSNGELAEARERTFELLGYFRKIRDGASESRSLMYLAGAERAAGNLVDAMATAEVSLEMSTRFGDQTTEIDALNVVGVVAKDMGDHARSQDAHRRALGLSRRSKARFPEVEALLGLGDPESVREALALARAGGYELLERRASDALAD